MQNENFNTELTITRTHVVATMIQNRLAVKGIGCFLMPAYDLNSRTDLENAMIIMVKESDLDRAKEILKDFEEGDEYVRYEDLVKNEFEEFDDDSTNQGQITGSETSTWDGCYLVFLAMLGAGSVVALIAWLVNTPLSDHGTGSFIFMGALLLIISATIWLYRNRKHHLSRIYRASVNSSKHQDLVWKDLKKYFAETDIRHSITEKEKIVQASFEISENSVIHFHYLVDDSYLCFRATIWDDFPEELTTDLFILATHFNNLLNLGVMRIFVDGRTISYDMTIDLLLPLLYNGEINSKIASHYNTAIDIHWAVQKLITDGEEPTIIIADLLRMKEDETKNEN